jgi:hypothetical protein
VRKTYFAIIAGSLAIAMVVMGGSRLRAQVGSTGSSRIPLSSLAGSFAGEGNSKVNICFNENFTAVQSCSRTLQAQIVPYVEHAKSHGTINAKGDSCAEIVEISAPVPPGRQETAVNHYIAVGVTTFYNPDTGSGDVSYKFYRRLGNLTCKGATSCCRPTLSTSAFGSTTRVTPPRADSRVLRPSTVKTTEARWQ